MWTHVKDTLYTINYTKNLNLSVFPNKRQPTNLASPIEKSCCWRFEVAMKELVSSSVDRQFLLPWPPKIPNHTMVLYPLFLLVAVVTVATCSRCVFSFAVPQMLE